MNQMKTKALAATKRSVANAMVEKAAANGVLLLNSVVHNKLKKEYGSTISSNVLAEMKRNARRVSTKAKTAPAETVTTTTKSGVVVHQNMLERDKNSARGRKAAATRKANKLKRDGALSPQKRGAATRKQNKQKAAVVLRQRSSRDVGGTIKAMLGYQPGSVVVSMGGDGQLWCSAPRRRIRL